MALAPKRGSELLGPVKNEGGVVGTAKHSVLIWLFTFPGLISDLHPGPVNRFGESQGSLVFNPGEFPSVPKICVKATPSHGVAAFIAASRRGLGRPAEHGRSSG